MWLAIYGTIVGTTSLLDLGVKYLGPLLAATNKHILEIYELVGLQELELKLLVEEVKCLQKAVQAMVSACRFGVASATPKPTVVVQLPPMRRLATLSFLKYF